MNGYTVLFGELMSPKNFLAGKFGRRVSIASICDKWIDLFSQFDEATCDKTVINFVKKDGGKLVLRSFDFAKDEEIFLALSNPDLPSHLYIHGVKILSRRGSIE